MSIPKNYIVEPQLPNSPVFVGTEGGQTEVYVGQVAEFGGARRVYFDASKEFVSLIIGKRGSGKSFCLGTLLEGLCTTNPESSISRIRTQRGVLLLDPMGNFWTSLFPVQGDGTERVREQWKLFEGWGITPEEINVVVWIPAGFKRDTDHAAIKEFHVDVSDLDAADWADVLGTNLIRDPQGVLLGEALDAIREEGWTDIEGRKRKPTRTYGIEDVIDYMESVRAAAVAGHNSDHASQTCRAVLRDFRSFARLPLFSGGATPLTEIIREGQLSVLMLPARIGHDLRRVLTRLLIRRIMRDREEASQIRNRLDFQSQIPDGERTQLESRLSGLIPRTVLAIDEAQELIGDEGQEARRALEDFCLLGRNYGLSMVLATQRPSVGAISAKVRAQVDTTIVHRLMTQEDIDVTWRNMQSAWPSSVKLRDRSLEYATLIRSLDVGQAVVSSSHIRLERDNGAARSFVMNVRPRIRVHGGETR
jgi:DNA helicase HerA-like ATPase